MTRAMWIMLGLVTVLTAWIFVQGILVGRLASSTETRRFRPLWILVPPLAPLAAFRAGSRVVPLVWLTLGVTYAILQTWALRY